MEGRERHLWTGGHLWTGEGPRCPIYWPVADIESLFQCELKAGHEDEFPMHFRSDNSI